MNLSKIQTKLKEKGIDVSLGYLVEITNHLKICQHTRFQSEGYQVVIGLSFLGNYSLDVHKLKG